VLGGAKRGEGREKTVKGKRFKREELRVRRRRDKSRLYGSEEKAS